MDFTEARPLADWTFSCVLDGNTETGRHVDTSSSEAQ